MNYSWKDAMDLSESNEGHMGECRVRERKWECYITISKEKEKEGINYPAEL